MIDSLELKLTPDMVSLQEWRDIEMNFNTESTHSYRKSNLTYRKRYLHNVNVTSGEKSYTIRGSLSKFVYGNNCYTMAFEDVQNALTVLEDTLGIPIKKAKVTRIDLAINMLMEHPPECYLKHLLYIDGHSRYDNKSTLTFKSNASEITFYDKVKEKKGKYSASPKIWKDENVLRYELRLKKNLDSLFETSVRVSNLFDVKFYIQLWEKWAEVYSHVQKSKDIQINLMRCKKPKDFEDQFLKKGYMAYGVAKALEDVNQLQRLNCFSQSSQYSKLRAKIKGFVTPEILSPPNELVQELDNKIENAILYYR